MWKALDLVTLPAPNKLILSIYNDQGIISRFWWILKRMHSSSPAAIQRALEVLVLGLTWGKHALANCVRLRPLATIRNWKAYGEQRGMSPWHDVVDWAGGYPFEVAKPEAVIAFYTEKGFRLDRATTCGRGRGCNEFLFTKAHEDVPSN